MYYFLEDYLIRMVETGEQKTGAFTQGWDNRLYVGAIMAKYIRNLGCTTVQLQTNIESALPGRAADALASHFVPNSAYAGRGLGMATLLPYAELTQEVVINGEFPYAEMRFWARIAELAGFEAPEIVTQPSFGKEIFVDPFIGTHQMVERYGQRTFPASEIVNDKAVMRKIITELNMDQYLIPGGQVFYSQGESVEGYRRKVYAHVMQALEEHNRIRLKIADSASGLSFVDIVRGNMSEDDILQKISSLLDGQDKFRNVVWEKYVEFGDEAEGFGDFSIRGFILPTGEFIPFSFGRTITDQVGVYQGMVMVDYTSFDDLIQVGLTEETVAEVIGISEKVARKMRGEYGYWGFYNVDFFALQHREDPVIWMHDYNNRRGGSDVSGGSLDVAELIFGKKQPIIDMQTHFSSQEKLSMVQIDRLLMMLQSLGVIPYASNFLAYPKAETEPHTYTYSQKLIFPAGEGQLDTRNRLNAYMRKVFTETAKVSGLPKFLV